MNNTNCIELVKEHIGIFHDFPKKGIIFRDICTAFQNGEVCKAIKYLLINYIKENNLEIDCIVGLESRGFLFSLMLASELGCSCVLIRKKGKLPGPIHSWKYELEYGFDTFEIQQNSIKGGQKVLLIDDLLATGGTLEAGIKLIEKTGGIVVKCLVIMELLSLNGRNRFGNDLIHSFIKYD